jgi:hypothetical protein
MSTHKTAAAAAKIAVMKKQKVTADKDSLFLQELEKVRKTFSDASEEVSKKLVLVMKGA